jgi:hypothetical protein
VVSRVPRGPIRLPGAASEADPAVVAAEVSNAEFVGFRIIGDAATPLGTGVFVKGANVSIVDVEISGALTVAIELNQMAGGGSPAATFTTILARPSRSVRARRRGSLTTSSPATGCRSGPRRRLSSRPARNRRLSATYFRE